MENEENLQSVEGTEEMGLIQDFSAIGKTHTTKANIFTNIKDKKKIFNLDNKVDNLLNDCEGELIRVKEILIKRYEKPLKNPKVIKEALIDETTGDILQDEVVRTTEINMSTILIDDNNKSYATGSKMFAIQLMRYIEMFGFDDEGFEIKIVKNKQQSGNKTLGFEVV